MQSMISETVACPRYHGIQGLEEQQHVSGEPADERGLQIPEFLLLQAPVQVRKSLCEAVLVGWASRYFERLRAGETVSFRPRGNSMTGRIESGQLCTVVPVDTATLKVGDVVLCKVRGNEYLHLVRAIQAIDSRLRNTTVTSMDG